MIVFNGTSTEVRPASGYRQLIGEIFGVECEKVGVRGGSTGHGLARSATPNWHYSVPSLSRDPLASGLSCMDWYRPVPRRPRILEPAWRLNSQPSEYVHPNPLGQARLCFEAVSWFFYKVHLISPKSGVSSSKDLVLSLPHANQPSSLASSTSIKNSTTIGQSCKGG